MRLLRFGLCLVLCLLNVPAWGDKTPAAPVPSDRWGPTLQPVAILGDTTSFVGHRDPANGQTKEYHDVDVENGYLFVATGQGMVIYDLRANPAPGFTLSYIFGASAREGVPAGNFPSWDHSDKDWYVKDVDAPPGVDSLVALSLDDQGFAVINTLVKSRPVVAYQRTLGVTRVYAFTSGGTHQAYAIAAAGRIHRFNLSAAAGMNGCLELVRPNEPPPVNCPGVYKGEVAGFGPFHNDIQGFGSFVATSSLGDAGVQVWSTASPEAPALRMQIPGRHLAAALWQQGSSIFLARLDSLGQLSIHDVSCIAAGPCAAAPALWTATLARRGPLTSLKLSTDGGHTYLYVGGDDLGVNTNDSTTTACLPQREHLYDVSVAAAPTELTPRTHPGGYWGWYYMECATGFNLVGPRRAVVYNGVLYRAAYSLLDAHRIAGDGPARLNGVGSPPPPLVVCQPVTFTAQGVSGKPTVFYSWSLTDAAQAPVPAGSSTGTLVWNTTPGTPPGTYTATLTVSNSLGSESKSATVTLGALPPLPAAGFVPAKDPSTGNTVVFHANAPGATGWNWDFDGDGLFNEADWTSDPERGPNPAFTYATPGTRQVRVKVRNCQNMAGVVSAALPVSIVGGRITVSGPASGQAGQAVQFTAFGSESCNPSADGWTWSAQGTTAVSQAENRATISWPATVRGGRTVTARNSGCPDVVGSTLVQIVAPLKSCFTVGQPVPGPGQPVAFDGSCSTGSPSSFIWDFGDSTPLGGPAAVISHAYAQPGTYRVTLTVARQGSECPTGFCESLPESKPVQVVSPLVADFVWEPSCQQPPCDPEVGRPVVFTDRSSGGPTAWSWTFGDGGTGTGRQVSHVFSRPGNFQVTLTAGLGGLTDDADKTVPVVLRSSAVLVPWVARNRGALVQTSDLYITNPGTVPMDVLIELRRRGTPELSPPRVARRVEPGATLYAADCIKSLFGRDENLSGFILVTPGLGSPQPVVTSHQTSGPPGSAFGTVVQGIPLTPAGGGLQLVGMNDNSKRTSFLGITNPNDAPATYRLRFFNAAGQAIGTPSGDLPLSRFGQKQFQSAEIRSNFGIAGQDDYRVAVESAAGTLFPFGLETWTSTGDPSLAGNGRGRPGRAWLIGVSNKPAADGKAWKTDAILSNTTAGPLAVNLTFTPLGVGAATAPSRVSLAAGATKRLDDVLKAQWHLTDAVGVIAIDSDPAGGGGALPAIFAESYRSPLLGQRYGHSMAVMTEADAAGAGRVHSLAGLRQDGKSRTTIWLLNAGAETGDFDVIYRRLDGSELGRIAVRLAPGRVRQLNPAQHPLPEGGAPDGFTVEIQVRAGKPLAAAQVVNNANDSVYIRGVTP